MSKKREQFEDEMGEWGSVVHHRNRAQRGPSRKARRKEDEGRDQPGMKRRQKPVRVDWDEDE